MAELYRRHEPADAARVLGAAEALRERIGAPLPASSREEYERTVGALVASLGAPAFDAARQEGRTLPTDVVVNALLADESEPVASDA
jgi:hypothetical protein